MTSILDQLNRATLLQQIITQDEVEVVRQGIQLLHDAIYRADSAVFLDILRKDFPKRVADELSNILAVPLTQKDFQTIKETLLSLEEMLGQLTVMSLDLAFEPSTEVIDTISAWVGREVGSRIILDIHIDRTIIGGARIVFKGRYWEKTLIQMIAEVLEQKRESILNKELL